MHSGNCLELIRIRLASTLHYINCFDYVILKREVLVMILPSVDSFFSTPFDQTIGLKWLLVMGD